MTKKEAKIFAVGIVLIVLLWVCWYAGVMHERKKHVSTPLNHSATDTILKQITDTSKIHARNVNAQKSEENRLSKVETKKKELHEIKNNFSPAWNDSIGDSLLVRWGQFERKHEKLLFEFGVRDSR